MRAIADLKAALAEGSINALTRLAAQPPSPMGPVLDKIIQTFPPRPAGLTALFAERLIEALRRFREREGAVDFKTLRLACHACALYMPKDGYVILADGKALAALLREVDEYGNEPRRFRRLYDGLLRAYLGVDRQAAWFANAGDGNELLRKFLATRVERVREPEPVPEWAHTLTSYRGILLREPGRRFADGLLAGDPSEFETACRGLGITGASWLATETVRSATAVAVAVKDHEAFRAHIPTLLELAGEERFKPLRNYVYAALLIRYAKIPSSPAHADLRDALVAAWGNPLLKRNEVRWPVSPREREMVAGWLKLHIIREFFDVLSDDKGQDRSRFEYWSRHYEQIDDVYIALGRAAYRSRDADMIKLKRALEGRLLQLTGTGADTSAFIMFIGDQVFVEFSQYGNAAYRYRRTDAPVDEGGGSLPITHLRQPPGEQMRHAGARGLTWQEIFDKVLSEGGRSVPSPSSRRRSTVSVGEIEAFARKHSLRLENFTDIGGNLWVIGSDRNSEVARQLKAWGFAYRQGKGWWRA